MPLPRPQVVCAALLARCAAALPGSMPLARPRLLGAALLAARCAADLPAFLAPDDDNMDYTEDPSQNYGEFFDSVVIPTRAAAARRPNFASLPFLATRRARGAGAVPELDA